MTEERITLNLYEKRIVWNREVIYLDYDLMNSRVLIVAGNEQFWMSYTEGIQFTPDFFVMVTSDNLIHSVSLLIRYGAEPAKKWSCTGAPLYGCFEDINGVQTEAECKLSCKGLPCTPVWKCEVPANGYENDGCGSRRANARCDPIIKFPLSLTSDKSTIKVGDLITVSGKYESFARVIIYEDSGLRPTLATVTCNSAAVYNAIVYLNKPVGTYKLQAKSDALVLPALSNIITITVVSDITHLECVNGKCTKVTGAGTDTCTIEGSTCGQLPLNSTHALSINLQPLSWANLDGLSAYLPSITTEFAKAITLYGWLGWEIIESRIESNKLVIYLHETSTIGNVSSLALPSLAAASGAIFTLLAIALRFGYLFIGWNLINLVTKSVDLLQTQAETEQIKVQYISDMCTSGELTPEQCNEALKPVPDDCWIPLPLGGCLLSAKTGKTIAYIGGGLALGYIGYKLLIKK